MKNAGLDSIKTAYQASPETICLGGILLDDKLLDGVGLHIPLQSMNRHGLIAGATGTGKTKTIQMLAEQLSEQGVPTLLMDLKGDLSGLAMPGEANEATITRQKQLHLALHNRAYPVELLAMGGQKGVGIRSTLMAFGALLFAKMLDLNETQAAMLSILFQYAKDQKRELIDLEDFKKLLLYAEGDGKVAIEAGYGGIASASLKAIRRSVVELESQGGGELFGEPAFDVADLIQCDAQGFGVASMLRLMNLQEKPKLFSTFMLGLLNAIYSQFPEVGDAAKPKIVIFIDEAHLIFHHASKALLERLENMVKLIRSKGVGLFFCTQSPNDIPEGVLGQLGLKIQHALRAFTAKDRKAIKLVAQNFPETPNYDVSDLLTSMGIGKALVSALDSQGRPMPLVFALFRAPQSRMGPLTESEITALTERSAMVNKYEKRTLHRSAIEGLPQNANPPPNKSRVPLAKSSGLEALSKNTLFRQLVRMVVKNFLQILTAAFRMSGSGKKK